MSRLTVGSIEGLTENSNVISVPTGHTLNAVDGLQIGGVGVGEWNTWTPTISTTGGTITSGTLGLARYSQVGNLIFARLRYSVTTAGTATGTQLNFTLPVALSSTYSNNDALGTGRETAVTGYGFNVFVNGSQATTQFYDGSGWIQNGRTASIVLLYEVD